MAHFAELNKENIVLRVVVINDSDCLDENKIESEMVGINFCKYLFGKNTIWLQTSYNRKLRKNFAGVGFTYDKKRDAFIAPQPDKEYLFDEETCNWIRKEIEK